MQGKNNREVQTGESSQNSIEPLSVLRVLGPMDRRQIVPVRFDSVYPRPYRFSMGMPKARALKVLDDY
jgi:hypothetical protein